eukprot:497722_1
MTTENVKLAKVKLFIRERPPTAGPSQHLVPTSPISVTHPKSYASHIQTPKRKTRDTESKRQKQITTIFNEYKSIKINNPKTLTSPRHEQKEFSFDKIFPHNTTQNTLFEEIAQPIVEHALNGYNSCCFAYGQTGSGKSYSIFGEKGIRRGLLPRSLDYLFQHLRVESSIKSRKSIKKMMHKKQQLNNNNKLCISNLKLNNNKIIPKLFNIDNDP